MPLKIALDTNCCPDFCAGDREVLERVQLAERVVLPFATLAELRRVSVWPTCATACSRRSARGTCTAWRHEE